jgi:hypothetical protein
MTMLVFHDSCVQDWWELHNYNANAWALKEVAEGLGVVGSGAPRLKAAMDALYGCPPNVFPFGKQYGWSDQAKHETYSYRIHLDDPLVQEALGVALPVSKLHKRIGPCEMTSFEILCQDRCVQATTFSDGTRIVANLSEKDAEAEGCGKVPALSWREI